MERCGLTPRLLPPRERVRAKALTRERVSAKNEVLPRFDLELARYASKNADLCFTGQIRLHLIPPPSSCARRDKKLGSP